MAAIKVNPNAALPYRIRGRIYKAKGDRANAIADFKHANTLDFDYEIDAELRELAKS